MRAWNLSKTLKWTLGLDGGVEGTLWIEISQATRGQCSWWTALAINRATLASWVRFANSCISHVFANSLGEKKERKFYIYVRIRYSCAFAIDAGKKRIWWNEYAFQRHYLVPWSREDADNEHEVIQNVHTLTSSSSVYTVCSYSGWYIPYLLGRRFAGWFHRGDLQRLNMLLGRQHRTERKRDTIHQVSLPVHNYAVAHHRENFSEEIYADRRGLSWFRSTGICFIKARNKIGEYLEDRSFGIETRNSYWVPSPKRKYRREKERVDNPSGLIYPSTNSKFTVISLHEIAKVERKKRV